MWLLLMFEAFKYPQRVWLGHLQKIRHLVCVLRPEHPLHRLGPPGEGQRVSPGLLRLLLLQEAAVHRGRVRAGGGEGPLQGPLRLHAGQPQAGRGERWRLISLKIIILLSSTHFKKITPTLFYVFKPIELPVINVLQMLYVGTEKLNFFHIVLMK